jgi:hypothetical protein
MLSHTSWKNKSLNRQSYKQMPLYLLLLFHPEFLWEQAINQGHHTHFENIELLANQSRNIKLNITAE